MCLNDTDTGIFLAASDKQTYWNLLQSYFVNAAHLRTKPNVRS